MDIGLGRACRVRGGETGEMRVNRWMMVDEQRILHAAAARV